MTKKDTKTGAKQEKKTGSAKTQFKKGQSGNPNGRPKRPSLTTKLREALADYESSTGKAFDELLVNRLLKEAIEKGDMRAIHMIWERMDGKVPQGLEHSGRNGSPIKTETAIQLGKDIRRLNSAWFDDTEK